MKRLVWFAVVLGLTACASRSAPPVRLGSAADVGRGLNNAGEATIPAGGTIVFQGDDLLYGAESPKKRGESRAGRRSTAGIPDQIFKLLGRRVTVQIHASPGETIRAGIERWKGRPIGDLLVVSYGHGDAAAGTTQADYRAALTEIVTSARAAGVPLFLITAPTAGDPELNVRLWVYRDVMRAMAAQGTAVFESQPSLDAQALHGGQQGAQSDAAYRAIAGLILQHIRLAPSRAAPSAPPGST